MKELGYVNMEVKINIIEDSQKRRFASDCLVFHFFMEKTNFLFLNTDSFIRVDNLTNFSGIL